MNAAPMDMLIRSGMSRRMVNLAEDDASPALPPELLQQLSRRHHRAGTTAARLRAALAAAPGPHSIDDLLITIWRQTGQVEKRSAVQHCLSFLRRRAEAESPARGMWQQPSPKGSTK